MDINYTSLGKKIRRERLKKNLTIEQLAEILGLSASYMGLIERGQRGISIETLCKLSNIFKVSTDYLLFSKDYNENNINTRLLNLFQEEIIDLTGECSKKNLRFIVEFIKLLKQHNV